MPAPSKLFFRSRRITSWIFGIVVLLSIVGLLVSYLLLQRERVADREFYETSVAPRLEKQNEAWKQSLEADKKALESGKHGHIAPLPSIDLQPLDEWTAKINREAEYSSLVYHFQMTLMAASAAWVLISLLLNLLIQYQRASPNRSADPGAGDLIEAYNEVEPVLVAKSKPNEKLKNQLWLILVCAAAGAIVPILKGQQTNPKALGISIIAALLPITIIFFIIERINRKHSAQKVSIDAKKKIATFYNFPFTAAFMGNKTQPCVEISFSDILGINFISGKGSNAIEVRTTKGKVSIPDSFEYFDEVRSLLTDAAEANRLNPVAFREALAREPVIRTPWYGWLILTGSIGLIALISWWAIRG